MPDSEDLRDVREELASLHRRLNVIEWRLGIGQAPAEPPVVVAPLPHVAPPPPAALPVAAEGGGATSPIPPAAGGGGPTLETTIGAHWLNRIGIAAVLVGTAFF